MSRLAGTRPKDQEGKTTKPAKSSGTWIVLVVGAFFAVVILAILSIAGYYSLTSGNRQQTAFVTVTSVTTAPSPASIEATTSIKSTTSETSSSSSTTTSTMYVTSTMGTATTTSTTLSKESIAFCMIRKINTVYVSNNMPSTSLRQYLKNYGNFPVMDCALEENKKACQDDIQGFIKTDDLILNGRPSKVMGYPVIVLSKDGSANLIPGVSEFERILDCGSLKE